MSKSSSSSVACSCRTKGIVNFCRYPHEVDNAGGSVANLVQGAMKEQLALSVWGLSSQRVEQFGRSEALVSGLTHHLFFLDHVHEFDPN